MAAASPRPTGSRDGWIKDNVGQVGVVYVESRISNASYEGDGEQVSTTDVIAQLLNLVSESRAHSHHG